MILHGSSVFHERFYTGKSMLLATVIPKTPTLWTFFHNSLNSDKY